MLCQLNKAYFTFPNPLSASVATIRYLRNSARGGTNPKLLKGQVKTVAIIESPPRIESYNDLLRHSRQSSVVDELEIEKHLTIGDDFGPGLEKSDQLHDIHIKEEKEHKSVVKKVIVKRKYFKAYIETNLLTCAAKEQIRYLHKLDPIKWSPEVLTESFPVSIYGVKKLLKSDFVIKSPERIKQHDEEVFQRWKILKSGESSPIISPLTQKLWEEGKLIDDNFMGNPNLPTAVLHELKEVICKENDEEIGEYFNIVKKYVDYKKSLEHEKQSSYNLLPPSENSFSKLPCEKRKSKKYGYIAPEELDNENFIKHISAKKLKEQSDVELQHHQFKESLLEKTRGQKSKTDNENEYFQWLKEQTPGKPVIEKQPYNMGTFFTKIPKYEKPIECKNNHEYEEDPYIYNDKLGYQHPYGKMNKGKIHIPSRLQKKGAVYKSGKCVYDSDGELLYKLPEASKSS